MSWMTSSLGASPGCLGIRGFLERSLVGETSGARAWPFEPVVAVVSVCVSAVVSAAAWVLAPPDGMFAGFVSLPQPAATRASRARSGAIRRISRGRLARGWRRRAGEGTRTPDILFTREVLYQLSYSGRGGER